MQVVRETTFWVPRSHGNSKPIVVLDINTDPLWKNLRSAANVNSALISNLKEFLESWQSQRTAQEEIVLNLNLSNPKYPLYLWEEALYLAVEEAAFAHEAFITIQGNPNSLHHLDSNRMLQRFTRSLEEGKVETRGLITDDNCETLLKKTIMRIIYEHDITKDQLEGILTATHNLEQFIQQCKAQTNGA